MPMAMPLFELEYPLLQASQVGEPHVGDGSCTIERRRSAVEDCRKLKALLREEEIEALRLHDDKLASDSLITCFDL
jgi:hypothetical protein